MSRGSTLVLVAVLLAGCGDSKKPPATWPDGILNPDGAVFLDIGLVDLGAPPDLGGDTDGPKIKVLTPAPNQIVVGNVLKLSAEITDPDGVNDQSVTATLSGRTPTTMSSTATPNTYEALLDISTIGDKGRVVVEARDLLNKRSALFVDFERDPGPRIQFLSPAEDSRHKGSVSVQVLVSDPRGITSFDLRIGSVKIAVTQQAGGDAKKQIWVGTIKFDDKIFSPALSGSQVLTATADNTNKAKTTASRKFVVDNEGPAITISSQVAGQLIGGVITISASITDAAGVLPSSVRAVIGNNLDTRTVELKASASSPDLYSGGFDTRTLTQYDLWPVISVRASDKLGNEGHQDIQVGLDNGQPIVELDPPTSFYHVRKGKDDKLECSKPFDPVGPEAANDLEAVPQITMLRARVEDQGNHVLSAPWVPISLVNKSTVWLYVLDDTAKALVVDKDGDGFCDDVNPEVVPIGSKPLPGEAVAVAMTPIPPAGSADFAGDPGGGVPLHPACDGWGTETKPPNPLCYSTYATAMTFYTASKSEPAIYGIPPVVPTSTYQCLGLPFDFKANSFTEGWVCVAVVADDNLTNRGVSPPLRLWYDQKLGKIGPLPGSAGTPPVCTGTLDKTTGKVDSSKPCKVRNPRATSLCDTSVEFRQMYCKMEGLKID